MSNEEFSEEVSEQHAGMTPLALACALNKLRSVKVLLFRFDTLLFSCMRIHCHASYRRQYTSFVRQFVLYGF